MDPRRASTGTKLRALRRPGQAQRRGASVRRRGVYVANASA